jgi:hypothetical protein
MTSDIRTPDDPNCGTQLAVKKSGTEIWVGCERLVVRWDILVEGKENLVEKLIIDTASLVGEYGTNLGWLHARLV